jgi:hypothetical protein
MLLLFPADVLSSKTFLTREFVCVRVERLSSVLFVAVLTARQYGRVDIILSIVCYYLQCHDRQIDTIDSTRDSLGEKA